MLRANDGPMPVRARAAMKGILLTMRAYNPSAAAEVDATVAVLRRVAKSIPHDLAEQLSSDLDTTRKMFKITPGGDTDRRLEMFVDALDEYVEALAELPEWMVLDD